MSEYLDLLNFTPDEFVCIFWKRRDEQHYSVLPPAAVDYAIGTIGEGFDVYLAPNPTRGPARTDEGGRGKMADVTRVNAVYADLDMKEGACADETVMWEIIGDLSGILGSRPSGVIFSGGGVQPIWLLEDCGPKVGAKLLRRFGRLAKIVAEARKANVDSVFDTARVLRMPDTLNFKYQPPRMAELLPDSGGPLSADELDERLNEAGVYDLGDDDELGTEVIARPSESQWAVSTCGYMTKLMAEWECEPVSDRHPWLLCQFVRLECARRYSCLSEADYLRAVSVLVTRFARECGRGGDERTVKRCEIRDIRIEAESRASRKTDAQLSMELGKSGGEGHAHSLESLIGSVSTESPPIMDSVELEAISEPVPGVIEAEEHFWDKRDILKEIYDFSLSRMCSPWAVLGACAAMGLAWVRPNATLPSLMGGRAGSLNFYATIAAGSGQGKSTAIGAAARLMPVKPFSTSVGSGEGMLESFVMWGPGANGGPAKRIGIKESVLIEIDEFDLLQAVSSRTGSSLISLLKTGFTGGKLSLTYANKKYPVLKENTYRLALIAAVQPGKAGWLFQDQAGGFPQRFMWFPGNDGRLSKDLYREMSYTMGLVLPQSSEYQYPREIFIPTAAREYILDNRAAAGRGDHDAGLNSHAAFTRLKFAYALTILDGRFECVTDEDWELSGTAVKVSDLTRDWVQQGIRAERVRSATEIGEHQGTVRAVAEETSLAYSARRAEAVIALVRDKIRTAESEGIADRDLRNAFKHKDRRYVKVAIDALAADGLIKPQTIGSKGGIKWVWV